VSDAVLLNEKEVALIVGMSVPWLRKGRNKGEGIPCLKIGRAVRYHRDEVQRWVVGLQCAT
jgi:predicted DNA-binding transcriptional regulator AlpA